MAKFKLTLAPLPDFKMPVKFVMANGDDAEIVFTVKHFSANEVKEMFSGDISNDEFIMKIATGWDLEDEFNKENVGKLVDLFMSVAPEFVTEYMKALAGQRVKN